MICYKLIRIMLNLNSVSFYQTSFVLKFCWLVIKACRVMQLRTKKLNKEVFSDSICDNQRCFQTAFVTISQDEQAVIFNGFVCSHQCLHLGGPEDGSSNNIESFYVTNQNR